MAVLIYTLDDFLTIMPRVLTPQAQACSFGNIGILACALVYISKNHALCSYLPNTPMIPVRKAVLS